MTTINRVFATAGDKTNEPSITEWLDRLAESASKDLASDGVLMSVLNDELFHSLGAFPCLGERLEARRHIADETVCIHTVESKALYEIEDAREVLTLNQTKYVRNGLIVGYLGVPLMIGEFGCVGAICAFDKQPRVWSEFERRYLQQVALSVELALLNEIRRIELSSIEEDFTELDNILSALSSKTSVPTSIYKPNGELAYTNAALSEVVPESYVSDFWSQHAMLPHSFFKKSDEPVASVQGAETPKSIVQVPGSAISFRVFSSTSASGLVVCSWHRCDALIH